VTTVQTALGPVEAAKLGRVLMHEHVFVMTADVQQNYPDEWGDEDQRVADAVRKLSELPKHGIYTFDEVPLFFSRRPKETMTDFFVRDITEGIAGTGVRAGMLKCAVDEKGLTDGVERVLRAVARAQRPPALRSPSPRPPSPTPPHPADPPRTCHLRRRQDRPPARQPRSRRASPTPADNSKKRGAPGYVSGSMSVRRASRERRSQRVIPIEARNGTSWLATSRAPW